MFFVVENVFLKVENVFFLKAKSVYSTVGKGTGRL